MKSSLASLHQVVRLVSLWMSVDEVMRYCFDVWLHVVEG